MIFFLCFQLCHVSKTRIKSERNEDDSNQKMPHWNLTQSGCSLGKVYCKLDFLLQTPLLLLYGNYLKVMTTWGLEKASFCYRRLLPPTFQQHLEKNVTVALCVLQVQMNLKHPGCGFCEECNSVWKESLGLIPLATTHAFIWIWTLCKLLSQNVFSNHVYHTFIQWVSLWFLGEWGGCF